MLTMFSSRRLCPRQGITKQQSPSRMMDDLAKLRAKRDTLNAELNKLNADIAQLEQNINRYLNPTIVTPPTPTQQDTLPRSTTNKPIATPQQHTQPLAAPQQELHTPHIQTPAYKQGFTSKPRVKPATNLEVTPPQHNAIQAQAVVEDRAPYHTESLQIVGVVPAVTIVMYSHYLYGDGISGGIQSPLGYTIKHMSSAAGKPYRLLEAPAMKITCTLATPLPTDIKAKKAAIREWLVANEWLASNDPTKAQFYTEYDAWGELYSPYISVDSKGTTLYIHIGCVSLQDPTPYPHLVA